MRKQIFGSVLGAVLLLAGCASSGSAGDTHQGTSTAGTVADVLRQTHATDATRRHVEFGDVAGVLKLNGGASADGPFSRLIGYGASAIAALRIPLAEKTGIDMLKASTAVTLGRPPNQVGVLYGSLDAAGIGAKLQALGYTGHDLGGGETAWVISDDHKVDMSGPLAELGVVDQLGVVHVSATRLVYAGATSDIDQELTGKPALADDKTFAGLADCLGAARAAILDTDPRTWPRPIGIGVTATSAADEEEELCVSTSGDAAATALAAAWPGRVAEAKSVADAEPWSDRLSAPRAKVIGGPAHVVRLTARAATDRARPGILFEALINRDLTSLLGTPSG